MDEVIEDDRERTKPAIRIAPCNASSNTFVLSSSISCCSPLPEPSAVLVPTAELALFGEPKLSRIPRSSSALKRMIHMMWNVASLAQADTADTKSHSAAKSVGTPTRGRYCSRHSLSC